MSNYWQKRIAKSQTNITNKSIQETEKQLIKYYRKTMETVIDDFIETYDKLQTAIDAGKPATPADLYKLDKYWQMQGELRQELEKLGYKQAALMSDSFTRQYQEIYRSLAIKGELTYNTIDRETARQMINQIWCADGKSWSSRVWTNTQQLADTLNDELINCVAAGRKTRDLKSLLQERFNVSYHRAETLVRTEMAHIQTQAAKQRYQDYGITEVEILADKDERRCEVCGKLHQKRYPIGAHVPIPAHANCRCCIVPVIDD